MPEAVIVAATRSPIGRANKGSLVDMRPDDLAAQVVEAALAQVPGARVEGSAPEPGKLWFSLRDYPPGDADRLRGIGDFLLTGLSGLEREHPGALKLTTERHWRE